MLSNRQREIIRNYYHILPDQEIAQMAEVSVPTVKKYARLWNLGAKMVSGRRNQWTTEEIDFLIATRDTLSNREIGRRLGRTENAVAIKLHNIQESRDQGRRKISLPPSDVQWLIDNYPYRTNEDIAKHLNMKTSRVQYLAKRYGLAKWIRPTNKTNPKQ